METIIAQDFTNKNNGATSSRCIRIVDGIIVDRYAKIPTSEPDREFFDTASPTHDNGYSISVFGCGKLHTREWGDEQRIQQMQVTFGNAETVD